MPATAITTPHRPIQTGDCVGLSVRPLIAAINAGATATSVLPACWLEELNADQRDALAADAELTERYARKVFTFLANQVPTETVGWSAMQTSPNRFSERGCAARLIEERAAEVAAQVARAAA